MKNFNTDQSDMFLLNHPLKTSFIEAAYSVESQREPVENLLAEYIGEAEARNDINHWNQFDDVFSIVEDFEKFVAFCEETYDNDYVFEL